jgi:hypothetical protein
MYIEIDGHDGDNRWFSRIDTSVWKLGKLFHGFFPGTGTDTGTGTGTGTSTDTGTGTDTDTGTDTGTGTYTGTGTNTSNGTGTGSALPLNWFVLMKHKAGFSCLNFRAFSKHLCSAAGCLDQELIFNFIWYT